MINADEEFVADVLITDDKIAAVGPNLVVPNQDATRVIDCTGKFIIPGGIDTHTQ